MKFMVMALGALAMFSCNKEQPAPAPTPDPDPTPAIQSFEVTVDAVEEVTEESVEEDVLIEDTMSSTIRNITGYALDGTVKSNFTQQVDMNVGYGRFIADENGNIYSVKYQYPTYEGNDTTEKTYLEACAPNGSKRWEIHLNEKMAEGEYFYVSGIFQNEMNQIILAFFCIIKIRSGSIPFHSDSHIIKLVGCGAFSCSNRKGQRCISIYGRF